MIFHYRLALIIALSALLTPPAASAANTAVHTTWLWHLHQPIYWPDHAPNNHAFDHYQNARDTIQLGNVHPSDTSLNTVFGMADRVAAYQAGPKNSLANLLGYANAGVQVNYSGALMENVQSLASAGTLGYGNGWNNNFQTAHSWTTSSGKPRMDLVNFTYHHALAPLLSDETLEMELRIHQRQMQLFWGASSRGYFPTETCFSERMIPILNKVGISWSVIGNTHLARACADFPVVTGSGGEQCDLPNLADQLNPSQGTGNYRRLSIDRGCSPIQVAPFGFQLHYARYVDPNTGAESKIILAPSDQVFGWKDSYSTWDLGLIDFIAARNNASKPSLVFCAHDGDNAWSGGSSYYNEWVPNMAGQATAKGYEPTTIEQFINDFPPDTNDVVHVEDGGWVFADSDFGSPMFINWHWPPSYSTNGANVVDPSLGVSDKADNWRVIIATENRVKTAQQISGTTPRVDQVRDPGSFSATPNAVELGWHYYLGSLDSGFVYYGCTADECLRAIVAQSNAVRNVNSLLSNLANDTTPPTVFIPQRHPWNPGGTNFGVQYGYKTVVAANSDFWLWTYAYDVSGITNVSLFLRVNGTNPPTSDQFKTYVGGPLAGAWQPASMTPRITGHSSGYTPQYLADYYYSKVTGISNAFVDYYVSATDARGNTFNSSIQHVYVGAGGGASSGGGTGGNGPVILSPTNPIAGNLVTISYNPAGRNLSAANPVAIHLGWNNWATVISPDLTMVLNASNLWQFTANIPASATQLDCVFNNGSGTWDNNSGSDWHFAVSASTNLVSPAPPQNLSAISAATNQINLSWSAVSGANIYLVNRDNATIGSAAAPSFSDTGLAAGSSHCYFITASNNVGVSAASATVCTNTPAVVLVTNLPPFVMNGTNDSAGYLLANNGMTLYGAVRGTTLYVATWSPGNSGLNDHFIFVTDQLLPAGAAAPWAKSGTVAVSASKPFLAAESQGTYVSWFNNATAVNWPCAKSTTNSGALEGTLDLVTAFGSVPTNLYLCAAAYITTNGGSLIAQCPAGSGVNIETNEFLILPLAALRDSWGNGTLDLCDSARGFKINSAAMQNSNRVLNFSAMPGRNYQVQFATQLGGAWSNLPATNFAAPPQTLLNFTDAPPAGTPQRFYRIKLLP